MISLYTTALLRPFVPPLSFSDPRQAAVLHRAAVLTLNGLALLALVVVLIRTGALAGVEPFLNLLTGYQLVFGTLLLAYLPAYTSHFAEAVLTFCVGCAVIADRIRPKARYALLAGAAAGLQWSLHPFSGSILILVSGLVFGLGRLRQGILFFIGAAGLVAAGLAAHFGLYGTWKFFYFEPQGYLFRWGAHHSQLSNSFFSPTNPGLTELSISARAKELGVSDQAAAETLARFRSFRAEVADPWKFALDRFKTQDFLVLNPLVFSALLVWMRGAAKNLRERWRERLWAALMVLGIYTGAVFLRSISGISFGNRHLIPAIAALLAVCWANSDRERDRPLLVCAFLVSVPMMLPGLIRTWQLPGQTFLNLNLAMTLFFYGFAVLWVAVPACEVRLLRAWICAEKNRWIQPVVLWAFAALQIAFYRPTPAIALSELAPAALVLVAATVILLWPARK